MSISQARHYWIAVAFVAMGAAWVLAQSAPKPAPSGKTTPPKPNPIVTITKLDKTVLRGQIASAEPDQLVVKPPGAGAEPLIVRWSQIAKVSNGLTQDQAAEQWKALQAPDTLCPDCHGDRGISCNDCRGTGYDQAKLVDCKDCGGGGLLFCPNKRCDDGNVDCPAPCIKLTQGRWVDRGGQKVRILPGGGWVSTGHLGELFEVEGGMPSPKGKCPTCGGTTKVDCRDCNGLAYKICPTCHFEGKTGPACPTCELGKTPCTTCNSTGLKKAA